MNLKMRHCQIRFARQCNTSRDQIVSRTWHVGNITRFSVLLTPFFRNQQTDREYNQTH